MRNQIHPSLYLHITKGNLLHSVQYLFRERHSATLLGQHCSRCCQPPLQTETVSLTAEISNVRVDRLPSPSLSYESRSETEDDCAHPVKSSVSPCAPTPFAYGARLRARILRAQALHIFRHEAVEGCVLICIHLGFTPKTHRAASRGR